MSVVIVGGNDRMVCQYKELCREYNCDAKVFTQMTGALKKKMGSPDLLILFTNTVSHKMVISAASEAKRINASVERCHSSSLSALREILQRRCYCS